MRSRPMSLPSGMALVRSRVAPRGEVRAPVPWKLRPVRGFWNSVIFSISSITALGTRMVFMV